MNVTVALTVNVAVAAIVNVSVAVCYFVSHTKVGRYFWEKNSRSKSHLVGKAKKKNLKSLKFLQCTKSLSYVTKFSRHFETLKWIQLLFHVNFKLISS